MSQRNVWKSASRAQHLKVLTGLASGQEGAVYPVSFNLELLNAHIAKLQKAWAEESEVSQEIHKPKLVAVSGVVAGNKLVRRVLRTRSRTAKVG